MSPAVRPYGWDLSLETLVHDMIILFSKQTKETDDRNFIYSQ